MPKVRKQRRTSPLLHAILALGSVAAVTLMMATGAASFGKASLRSPSQNIMVQHEEPLTMTIAVAENAQSSVVDIAHEGGEGIFVAVPLTWTLREVRGASIADVPADPPALDFRRWRLPAGVALSFDVPFVDPSFAIYNPTTIPLHVKWKRVNVVTKKVQEDAALLTEKSVQF